MIKLQELYAQKQDCCGCELCSVVCPRNVLTMKPDDEGFLYPSILNIDNCVDCKMCIGVCPMKTSSVPPKNLIKGYGGHAKDESDIRKSSSGGLSTAIGLWFLKNGGVVYGVRYSEDFHSARYSRATTIEELELFRTSKYFQARKGDVFKQVKLDLNESKKVLFVGLSCEIAALLNYLGRSYDNLFTVALICHGVTSPEVHNQFCKNLEKDAGSAITSFSVRHKKDGWKPYYIKADFTNGNEYLKTFVSTDYEIAFKYLKRPSCSNCQFKLLNKKFGIMADMIIGDFHGQKSSDPFYNKWGASQFYTCTMKGEELRANLGDFLQTEITVAGKVWSQPVLCVPTKKMLFNGLYSKYFQHNGLIKASNSIVIKISYKHLQPIIKNYYSFMRKLQIKLFHKIYKW